VKEKQIERKIDKINNELMHYNSMLIMKQNPKPSLTMEEQKLKMEKIFQQVKIDRLAKEYENDLERELGLSYRHFKQSGQSKGPIISIGWRVNHEDNFSEYEYTIAICSKNDFFDRGYARSLINERFNMQNTIRFCIENITPGVTPVIKGEIELIKGHYNANKIPNVFSMKEIPNNARFIP